MAIISRGFSGRRGGADAKLPPGQYLTTDFPVLSAGPTRRVSLDKWEFTIDDGSVLEGCNCNEDARERIRQHCAVSIVIFRLSGDTVQVNCDALETSPHKE